MTTRTVLIVDDSQMIRSQVAAALTPAGFQVIEARDGIEGLEQIESTELCLVILDLHMPRLNGIETLQRIKANPRNATLPVLLLTTDVQPAVISRAKQIGARGYLIKPVKPEHLVSTAQKLAL